MTKTFTIIFKMFR